MKNAKLKTGLLQLTKTKTITQVFFFVTWNKIKTS